MQITLFGEFSLVYRNEAPPGFKGERPLSLLAYLLLHRHTTVSRQRLAYTFWPDSSDSQARANLRNLYYTLRHALPNADNYLVADALTLQWRNDADFSLDVAAFEDALAAAQTAESPAEKQRWLETAGAYYKGDLLPGNYDDWIIPLREEFRRAYLDALHELTRLLEKAGDYRAAARYGQRLLQSDPLDESAYVQLMRLHALSGDRAGVQRLYGACVATLRRELDVAPGPATHAAYEQLLRLEAPATAAVPSSADPEPMEMVEPASARPLPLPVPATPFIGREAEVAQIAELLADPACRLLTIVGPGGIGKTRLALQTAAGHQPIYPDGVAWVGLQALQTPAQLAAAIAESLNYRLRGAAGPETELLPLLAHKELLLALDNFEHLLSATDFLTRLLEQTTSVKLLVTSRQALELPAEWRFDLNALPLPDEESPAAVANNSAVQLFVQSGRRTSGAFAPTAADFAAIARICHLVGGMPLGVELAASWLRLLSCAEIAREIERSLDFLTVTNRHLPPRHRSLRAVFDYSWNLLTPAAQQILLRLSIFRGGFTREAAEQVAGAELAQLAALADRSLVQRTTAGRHQLHNVIRQYAADQQHTGCHAAQETAARHSRFYLQWLAEQDTVLRGPGQKNGLTAVAADLANIRAAWHWAAAQRQIGLLRGAAFPLFYFYEVRGLLSEGETAFRMAAEALQREMESADQDEAGVVTCALQTYQAYLCFRQGKVAVAEGLLRAAVAKLETGADDTLLEHALFYLGILDWAVGNSARALDGLQRAWMLADRRQDVWEAVMARVYLGLVRHDQGQLREAHQQLTGAYSAARKVGDPRLLANTLLISGRINLLLGHLDDAARQLAECLEMGQETGDPNSITYATHYLGMVKQAQGDLAAARQLIEHSMALYAHFNDAVGLERAWVTLGFLEISAGNVAAARSHFLAFLHVTQRTHSVRYVLAAVVGMAMVGAQTGAAPAALVWTLSVLHHAGIDWETRQRAETLRAALEQQLTPDQLAAARQQATALSFEAVLNDVLSQ